MAVLCGLTGGELAVGMRRRVGTALGQPYISTAVVALCNRRNYAACSTRRLMRRRCTPGSIHRPRPIQKAHSFSTAAVSKVLAGPVEVLGLRPLDTRRLWQLGLLEP